MSLAAKLVMLSAFSLACGFCLGYLFALLQGLNEEMRRDIVGEDNVTIFQISRKGDKVKIVERPDGSKYMIGDGDPDRCKKAYQYLAAEGFLD